jgi:hypothetical protein
MAIALLALVVAPQVGAWHGEEIVIVDTVVPAGLTRIEYSPPVHLTSGDVRIECNGAPASFAWMASNVTSDLSWWTPCATWASRELAWQERGAGYVVLVAASAPTRVVVWGDPGVPEYGEADDGRASAFHYAVEGDAAWANDAGRFTAQRDMTGVIIESWGTVAAELYQLTPEPVLLGHSTDEGTPVADLVEGGEYLVRFTFLSSCQPACFAYSDVSVRGYPAD